jgi:hypothetical protein
MNSFFFWFIRPLAEFLGAILLIAILAAVITGIQAFYDRKSKGKK